MQDFRYFVAEKIFRVPYVSLLHIIDLERARSLNPDQGLFQYHALKLGHSIPFILVSDLFIDVEITHPVIFTPHKPRPLIMCKPYHMIHGLDHVQVDSHGEAHKFP